MLVTIVLTPILANCAKQSSNIQTVLNKLQEAIENSFNSFLQIILQQMRTNVTD